MNRLHQVLSAAQMQAAEARLIEGGESVESLMERAGRGAADWVWRMAAGRPVTVLCGPGNNGGDGYVIAGVLAERGLEVKVVAPVPPATDAAKAAKAKWGGTPVERANGAVLVDCLFGTGLSRPLSDELRHLLAQLADSHDLRIAIDLPSGIDSDSGEFLNDGLPDYDLTVALGAWKRAHWLMPAAARMGDRRLVDIGVDRVAGAALLSPPAQLDPPQPTTHKYKRGLLLVVGGDMPGASVLAVRAAQHSGAGYVKLASREAPPGLPVEVVVERGRLEDVLGDDRIDALLVGPGLGHSEDARQNLRAAMASGKPIVLDADALALLGPDFPLGDAARVLCTPHEGELAQMCEAFGIEDGAKLGRATALHEKTGMTVLAKGADTILVGEGEVHFFSPGSSWLSTAGTGDVLAGIAASRMATAETPFEAARQAVQLHSEAARLAGPVFTAGELADRLPQAYLAPR